MSLPTDLSSWLSYLETLHPKTIAMGLERVALVYQKLGSRIAVPVITVAGTNGKGSTCAMIESMLRHGGFRTGLYTSPHLLRYNERVRINGAQVNDLDLCKAFAAVERVRTDVPLTYFEYGTLAALWLFDAAKLDVIVLEVGLGGRLDAVNIIDADVAVITSIDFDHMDYLGATREQIGYEKAGIFRAGKPAVCAEPNVPNSVLEHARALSTPLHRIGKDFGYVNEGGQWLFWSRHQQDIRRRGGLPFPSLRGSYQLANAATALATLELVDNRLPLPANAIRAGLVGVELAGRFQVLPGRPTVVLDVAHNPHAARTLAASLSEQGFFACTWGIFGMYQDKDHVGVIHALLDRIDHWLVATLPGARGATAQQLRTSLRQCGVKDERITIFEDVASAYRHVWERADEADRIAAFGSFLTVAGVLNARNGE